MKATTAILISMMFSSLSLSAQVRGGNALSKDKTGIAWVAPFTDATAKAKKSNRLLMVKPIAYGTDKAGCWWPAGEVLRVGPFCDPRVIALANRRFTPFAFDLNNRGGIPDAAAKKTVTAAEPKLAGKFVPTPEVLFMSPDGKVLGKISNYATEPQFLEAMQKVLKENPEYNKESAQEKSATTALERGRIAFELLDFDTSKKELASLKQDEASYLLARMARYEKDWKSMESHLLSITSEQWKDDAVMERMRMHIAKRNFAYSIQLSGSIPHTSNRFTEAQYFKGVAQFQMGKAKLAVETWKQLITGQKLHDNWVYRADWAYCEVKQKESRVMSTSGKRVSLLGRIGYMGRRNPDLIKL